MNNVVAIKATVEEIGQKEQIVFGFKMTHYKLKLSTTRTSGAKDYINVIAREDLKEKIETISTGDGVVCTGKVQTLKDWTTGKVLVYVLADYIGKIEGKREFWQDENEVILKGEVAKAPIYRETPKGRHITDTTIKVESELQKTSFCYIPTVFWGKLAKSVKEYKEGDQIKIRGRLQSRDYIKKQEDKEELRTAYELSAGTLEE